MAEKEQAADEAAEKARASARRIIANTQIAPPVRVITHWRPEQLRAAEQAAEQGYLRQAVTICEWLLTDDRLAAVLDTRIDQLLGLEPTFEPGLGRRKRKAAKALEAGEDFWEAYPESELRHMLRWGILLGGSVHRHNWTERKDHGGRVLPMPRFWHPQTLQFDWNLRKLTIWDSENREHEVIPGDSQWIFHTPFGFERFWAQGLWRSLSRWVLLKQYAQGDWARHGSTGTTRVASTTEGVTEEERKELAKEILAASTDPVIALPAGFTLDLLEAKADTKAIYQAQIDAADNAIAIRIRGGNLTTSVDGKGSYAAAKTQAVTGDGAKLRFDAAALSTTLNQQSLAWWAEFNFGDPRLAPWPTWPVDPEEDKTARATMVKTLGEGLTTMLALGFEIDPKKLTEEFGLSFITGRKEPEPAPAAGEPGADPAQGGKTPDPAEPERKKEGKARKPRKARAQHATRSGVPVLAASGFYEGQQYVDALVDDSRSKAATAYSPFLDGLLEVIDVATDWDDLKARVLAKYAESESPEQVRNILGMAQVLADLAGAAAVRQDA